MSFYQFRQNNSGGSFDIDEERGISISVIVEADSYEEANRRAERIGLYFDGCQSGRDCSCCGDRWYEKWCDDEGDEVPSNYGTPLVEASDFTFNWAGDKPDTFVHLRDGRKFAFYLVDKQYVYKGDPSLLAEALPGSPVKAIEP